jgi:hypothetical protein
MNGKAQSTADFSGMLDATRVVGSDLLSNTISSAGTSYAGAFGSGTALVYLGPTEMSPRLAALEELYEFFCFRKLTFMYMPNCSSTTTGSLGCGLISDPLQAVAIFTTGGSQQQLLESDPSFITPLWQGASWTYTNTGSKLFSTYASTGVEPAQNYIQGVLVALFNSSSQSSGQYGQVWIEYVIDFYKPRCFYTSNPALEVPKTKVTRGDMIQEQHQLLGGMRQGSGSEKGLVRKIAELVWENKHHLLPLVLGSSSGEHSADPEPNGPVLQTRATRQESPRGPLPPYPYGGVSAGVEARLPPRP